MNDTVALIKSLEVLPYYYVVSMIGVWLISDGIFSWVLYANKASWRAEDKQTFLKDHWIRLIRIILGVALIMIGVVNGI